MNSISAVLGVVVGVAFLFALLSLIASAAAEVISAAFRLRASMLDRTIRALLTGVWAKTAGDQDPHAAAASALLSDPRCRTGFPGMQNKRPEPSYLATATFVDLVFTHFVAPGSPSRDQADRAVVGLPAGGAGDVLRHLWADADQDVEAFRDHVARWYDDAMSRLSGWYKRRLRFILFGLGALLAVGLNVSLLNVGKTLWVDPLARDAVMAQARIAPSPTGTTSALPGDPAAAMLTNYRALTDQRLPLGWRAGALPKTGPGWAAAIAGWLMVALGVSLGSPFWFDVLSRFANLKLSGNAPRAGPDTIAAITARRRRAARRATESTTARADRSEATDRASDATATSAPTPVQPATATSAPTPVQPATATSGATSGVSIVASTSSAVGPQSGRTGFDPAVHGFHFDNHFENTYEVPFAVGKSITTYGRCGGMAYSSLDLFLADQAVPAIQDAPADDTPLARYILRRLIDSWVNPSATRFITWSTRDDRTLHALTGHEFDVATTALDQGQPVPLGLIAADAISGVGHNHQVLAIGYDRRPDGSVDVLIYDNNTHDETVTLTWEPSGTGVAATNRGTPWRGCFVHSYSPQEPPSAL